MGEILRKADLFDEPAPGANSDILPADIVPARATSTLRLSCAFENQTVFKVVISDGVTTREMPLNQRIPLEAEGMYNFTFSASWDFSYNFQIETDGAVRTLMVEEVTGGVI